MSRLYDTVEPAVVDDDMLQKAVEEQGPKEEAGKIARDEGIDFKDVVALRLDFKSTGSKVVSNFFFISFFSLTKICLQFMILRICFSFYFNIQFFRYLENRQPLVLQILDKTST